MAYLGREMTTCIHYTINSAEGHTYKRSHITEPAGHVVATTANYCGM